MPNLEQIMPKFETLSLDRAMTWLSVDDVRPKHNHAVLLYARDGRQQVGHLDANISMWVIANEVTPFDNFTHWRLLPEGPTS